MRPNVNNSRDLKLEDAALGLHNKIMIPLVRKSTDHMGASSGSMNIEKMRKSGSRNPGIGNGRRSRTIQHNVKPITPTKTRATPEAFRMAAIVAEAKIAHNRRLHKLALFLRQFSSLPTVAEFQFLSHDWLWYIAKP